MAFSHGRNTKIYANGWLMSDFFTSIETPLSRDTAETTVFNSSGYKSYLAGSQDATLSAEGMWGGTTAEASQALDDMTSRASSSGVVWTWYPDGDAAAKFGYGLVTHQTGYNVSAPVAGVVSNSVEGQSYTARESIESLKPMAAITSSGIGSVDDNTAATTNGGAGYFQKNDNSTRSVTATIQHSSSGSVYTDLVTFTAATTGRKGQRVTVNGLVKRYLRAEWTQSGATTISNTFHIGFNRRTSP